MVLVSFILNINSIHSLENCFSSFCSQSFNDFEIICLSDCLDTEELNLIDSYKDKISISKNSADSIISTAKGDYICFFNYDSILSNENSLEDVISIVKDNNYDMFSANVKFFKDKITCKNIFYDLNSIKTFDKVKPHPIKLDNLNYTLSNNLFKKDFLIKENIQYNKNEILLFTDIISKIDEFLGIPVDFCKDNYDRQIDSKGCVSLFKTYKKLLTVFSDEKDILNTVSNNILQNKFILQSFSLEDYDVLKTDFSEIREMLKSNDFNLSNDVLNYLRYLKEMVECQVKSYDVAISIVIPTYNVEKYIGDCLTSILNQSFGDFEIIVVDDCSTDSTLETVKYFAKKDKRISYFVNSIKCGSGGSRNFGLKHASGKYVQFVDGDDWLDRTALEKLYSTAEHFRTQSVMFKVINFKDFGTRFSEDDYLSISCLEKFKNSVFNSNEIYDEMFKISVVPVNKLYLRSFLVDIDARFPEKYIHQDNPFFYQTFCASECIYLLDEFLYNRRLWKGSITSLRDDTELGTIEIVEEILKVFIENGFYEKFKEPLLNRLIFKLRNRYNLVGNSYKEEYYLRTKKKLKKFMFDYDLCDDLMDNLWRDNKKYFDNLIHSENFDEFKGFLDNSMY